MHQNGPFLPKFSFPYNLEKYVGDFLNLRYLMRKVRLVPIFGHKIAKTAISTLNNQKTPKTGNNKNHLPIPVDIITSMV